MGEKNTMLWFILIAIFILCAYWHIRENRDLAQRWHNEMDAEKAEKLKRFAWLRTLQLLFALICVIIIVMMYDVRLNSAYHDIDALEKYKAVAEQKLAPKEIMPEVSIHIERPPPMKPEQNAADASATKPIQTAKSPFSNPSGNANAPVQDGDLAQQAIQQNALDMQRSIYQPGQSAPLGTTAQTFGPADAKQDVTDVYSPESKSNDKESSIDAIKKRYEDILVTHMFLKKCGRVSASDYPIITAALAQEMASLNAPGRLQYDIQTAAEGSYNELYARTSCEGSGIEALNEQYNDYIKALSKNVQAH